MFIKIKTYSYELMTMDKEGRVYNECPKEDVGVFKGEMILNTESIKTIVRCCYNDDNGNHISDNFYNIGIGSGYITIDKHDLQDIVKIIDAPMI